MRWLDAARARLRLLFARRAAELRMEDEMRFHVEMEADRLMREGGLDAREAQRRAFMAFGGIEKYREELREGRGLAWLTGMSLDFRLGFRMLRKYPGLTVIGGIAVAFAMALGAVSFELMLQASRPSIPLPGGDRIVALRLWETTRSTLAQSTLHDFTSWRDELTSIADVGAYRTFERNLIGTDRLGLPVRAAAMTASGFRVAGVAPLLGRPLVDNDQGAVAPAVVVIGEVVWRTRFDSDPAVIGRAVRLGAEHHTVVGVMPASFAFPLYHDVWIPLRLRAEGYGPGEGGSVGVFGRLAPGATLKRAQLELTTLGARAASDFGDSHAHLRPQVVPFAKSVFDAEPMVASFIVNGFMVVFMLLLYANVALLMFARAATRESELVVRNALGASRGRILVQLFTEALVLGMVGAVIGLVFARLGVGWAFWFIAENGVDLPFWYRDGLSRSTIVYAMGVTVLAAVVSGVIPALKVTRGLGRQLRAVGAGGGGQQFGGLWTAIIVTQVAVTAAFFPLLVSLGTGTAEARAVELGVSAEEYLTVRLEQDETESIESAASRDPAAKLEDLKRRVSGEPQVTGVTFAHQFPGGYHPQAAIEVDGVPELLPSGVRPRAQRATVDLDFFDVMGARVLSGRSFHSADLTSDAKAVIVNESFARIVLGERNPIGKRLRYHEIGEDAEGRRTEEPGPWYEIVGQVRDLALWAAPEMANGAGIYHPLSLDDAASIRMAVHVGRDPERFAPRLRELAAAVDPALRVKDVERLDVMASAYVTAITFWFRVLVFAGAIALLLSLAGVYSVLAFTVSRRTREIGIRVALGSGRSSIMAALFSRTLVQVGLGVLVGAGAWALFTFGDSDASVLTDFANGFASLLAYAMMMMAVCMLACIVPARRALSVQPTEALRADG